MPADSTPPARRMSRDAALDVLARRPTDQVVVSTMTALRPWAARSSGDRDLLNMGFMGGASTYGLGVALARPDVAVWVLDGDGSLLMQLGSLATIAHAAPANFLHVVLHNGVYETSGAQVIPGAGRISFAGMAREAGYADTVRFDDVEAFDAQLDEILSWDGPTLVELITAPSGSYYQPGPPPRERPIPAVARNWPLVRDALIKPEGGTR